MQVSNSKTARRMAWIKEPSSVEFQQRCIHRAFESLPVFGWLLYLAGLLERALARLLRAAMLATGSMARLILSLSLAPASAGYF